MIRLLIPLILLVIAVILAKRYLENAPPDLKKQRQLNLAIGALTIMLLILSLLHRMHWIAPLLSVVILAVRLLMQNLSKQAATQKESTSIATSATSITEEVALQILGLKKPYGENEVIEAHRNLIQKLHPDRGGNDYLASQINHARDKLLELLKTTPH